MGYSCAAAASLVLDAISELIAAELAKRPEFAGKNVSSNAMPDGGFWERGREQSDGAITGTVYKRTSTYSPAERAARARQMGADVKPEWIGDPCRRAGSFRIEPDGRVSRFPGIRASLLRRAEQIGAAKYRETFGPRDDRDWRKSRDSIISVLNEGVDPKYLWDDLQEVARVYQSEKVITFLSLPGLNKADMIEWLAGLD